MKGNKCENNQKISAEHICSLFRNTGCTEHILLNRSYSADISAEYEKDYWEDPDEINLGVIEDGNGTLPDKILDEILDYVPITGKSKDEFEYIETAYRALDTMENCLNEAVYNMHGDWEKDYTKGHRFHKFAYNISLCQVIVGNLPFFFSL